MNGLSLFANELLKERGEFYKHLYPACDMVVGDIS